MVKKKVGKNEKEKIKKEFYAYQDKVIRLKQLEHELNTLDTKGFETNASAIRSKLKDPKAIPEIEHALKVLRQKILAKNHHIPKPHSSLNSLRVELKSQLKDLKEHDVELQSKVNALKQHVTHMKKHDLEEHYKKVPIDPSVGFSIDKKFQGFTEQVKSEFSQRVRNKEKALEEQMKQELNQKKRVLEDNYNAKLSALKQWYSAKIQEEAEALAREQIRKQVPEKLQRERQKIQKAYEDSFKQHFDEQVEKQKKVLQQEMNSELKKQETELRSGVEQERQTLRILERKAQKVLEEKKHVLAKEFVERSIQYKKKLDSSVQVEVSKKLKQELDSRLIEERERLKNEYLTTFQEEYDVALHREKQKMRAELQEQMRVKEDAMRKHLEREGKILRQKQQAVVSAAREHLASEFSHKVRDAVVKKEIQLKEQLNKKLESDLKSHVAEHDLLWKKKLEQYHLSASQDKKKLQQQITIEKQKLEQQFNLQLKKQSVANQESLNKLRVQKAKARDSKNAALERKLVSQQKLLEIGFKAKEQELKQQLVKQKTILEIKERAELGKRAQAMEKTLESHKKQLQQQFNSRYHAQLDQELKSREQKLRSALQTEIASSLALKQQQAVGKVKAQSEKEKIALRKSIEAQKQKELSQKLAEQKASFEQQKKLLEQEKKAFEQRVQLQMKQKVKALFG